MKKRYVPARARVIPTCGVSKDMYAPGRCGVEAQHVALALCSPSHSRLRWPDVQSSERACFGHPQPPFKHGAVVVAVAVLCLERSVDQADGLIRGCRVVAVAREVADGRAATDIVVHRAGGVRAHQAVCGWWWDAA